MLIKASNTYIYIYIYIQAHIHVNDIKLKETYQLTSESIKTSF